MKNLRRLLALWGVMMLLAGCASAPLASAADDAAAKTFTPLAGQASLYISHGADLLGPESYSVIVDGKILGELFKGTFYLITLAPGHHNILATGIASSKYGSSTMSARARIEAKADTNYFFGIYTFLGLRLDQVTDVGKARTDVMGEKRAESLID
jgi:hypothetical protein